MAERADSLQEVIEPNTLVNFLHAFEADAATTRLLRRGIWLVPEIKYRAKDEDSVKDEDSAKDEDKSRTKIVKNEEVFLDAFIEKLVKAGVIEKTLRNGYGAKLKLIPKSDGTLRMNIDFSNLRGILKSPPVFLPGILYLLKKHLELFKKFAKKIITNMFVQCANNTSM